MTGATRLRRTTLLSCLFVALLIGVWFGRHWPFPGALWLITSGAVVLLTARRRSIGLAIALAIFGLIAGWWRGTSYLPNLLRYQNLHNQQISLEVTALEDSVYDNGQIAFDADTIVLPSREKIPGRIVVLGRGVPMVYKGDRLKVSGNLRLARGSRQARISYAELVLLERSYNPIDVFRRKFTAGLLSVVPEPQASFGMGLLVGQRDTLPEDVAEELSAVGLTHLIAVSGYNLTVIVMAARRLSGKRSKYQSVVLAAGLITLFLLVTGFSASIVRAAIVSGLSLTAWYYGRKIPPVLLLLSAAVATAMWYPFYVWVDIGWYLSFLAFFGVLVIAPVVQRRLIKGDTEPPLLQSVAIESFAAQIMTIPIILFIFGRLSVVSLATNMLAVPVTPYAMLASLVAGFAGMLGGPALIASWPATILLGYMLAVAALASRLPFASVEVEITWPVMMGMYSMIGLTAWLVASKNRRKYGTITDVKEKQMEY